MRRLTWCAVVLVATRLDASPPATVHTITESALWHPPATLSVATDASGATATPAWLAEWPRLHADDESYEPTAARAPQIPSSCLEQGGDACASCFAPAYAKLEFVRATLERLRAIYQATKASTDRAIATGDAIAPSTGVAEYEWNYQKNGIAQEMKNLERTYRLKYEGLMGTLRGALGDIAHCEQQLGQESRWYERFGVVYFTYMHDRYQLTE